MHSARGSEAVGPWKCKGDIISFKDIIYILLTSPLTESILKETHDNTHMGYHKGLRRVRAIFYWQGMKT